MAPVTAQPETRVSVSVSLSLVLGEPSESMAVLRLQPALSYLRPMRQNENDSSNLSPCNDWPTDMPRQAAFSELHCPHL